MICELSVGELVVVIHPLALPGVNLSSIFVSIFLLAVLPSTPLLTSFFSTSEQVKKFLLFFRMSATQSVSLKRMCTFGLKNGRPRGELSWRGGVVVFFPLTIKKKDVYERKCPS